MDEYFKTYLNLNIKGVTLTMQYAKDGNVEAVDWLIEHCGASEADAVHGFAWGGHQDEMTSRVKKNPALQTAAVTGLARRGNKDITRAFFTTYPDCKPHAGCGYALALNHDMVNVFLKMQTWPANVVHVLEGFALVGEAAETRRILAGTTYLEPVLLAAARGGQRELVNALLTESKGNIHQRNALINTAIEGYILGRHFTEAAELCLAPINISTAIAKLSNFSGFDAHSFNLFISHLEDPKMKEAAKKAALQFCLDLQPDEITLKPCESEYKSDRVTLETLREYYEGHYPKL